MTNIKIKNESSLSDEKALERVLRVIRMGKISIKKETPVYCFATTFDDCIVTAELTEAGTQMFTLK
jgi:hypothetical protein